MRKRDIHPKSPRQEANTRHLLERREQKKKNQWVTEMKLRKEAKKLKIPLDELKRQKIVLAAKQEKVYTSEMPVASTSQSQGKGYSRW